MELLLQIKEDFRVYTNSNGRFQFEEPSFICLLLYRIGHRILQIKFKPLRIILAILHYPFFLLFNTLFGIYLPRGAKIGEGLRIYHHGCIIVNPDTKMGHHCVLRQGVTIGTKNSDHDVPKIGNYVEFGAGCKVLGDIVVGNHVIIGANAVVLTDVPDDSIAVGIPARIFPRK